MHSALIDRTMIGIDLPGSSGYNQIGRAVPEGGSLD